MSKRLIIFIYVVAVLIFSGFIAQAKTVDGINVSAAKIDKRSTVLMMAGQLSNTCMARPTAALEKVEGNVLVFSVIATISEQRCSDQLGKEFEVAVDLKEIPLVEGQEYAIHINNYSGPRIHLGFVAPKNTGFLQISGEAQHGFSGVIKQKDQIMMEKNDQIIKVDTSSINLAAAAEHEVYVKGYAVQNQNSETVIVPVSVSVLN